MSQHTGIVRSSPDLAPRVDTHTPSLQAKYYTEKLELPDASARWTSEVVAHYIRGLHWVLQYYYRGVASWDWFYPYHYAPMAQDMRQLGNIDGEGNFLAILGHFWAQLHCIKFFFLGKRDKYLTASAQQALGWRLALQMVVAGWLAGTHTICASMVRVGHSPSHCLVPSFLLTLVLTPSSSSACICPALPSAQ